MLSDEQIEAIYTQETGALIDDSPWALVNFSRAIESAACEERDARIAHLEATASANYGRGHADAHSMLADRIAELERQLEEARKPQQPITEEELKNGRKAVTDDPEEQPEPWAFRMGVYFAERHHGIKEQP